LAKSSAAAGVGGLSAAVAGEIAAAQAKIAALQAQRTAVANMFLSGQIGTEAYLATIQDINAAILFEQEWIIWVSAM
jgi:hypothetical protein